MIPLHSCLSPWLVSCVPLDALAVSGGRGGGKPTQAQGTSKTGGGMVAETLAAATEFAASKLG